MGLRGRRRARFVHRDRRRRDRVRARGGGDAARGSGGGAGGTSTGVLLARRRALPPSGAMLAGGVCGVPAVLGDNFHRAGNAASAAPVDGHERAGAHDAPCADRARRDARALERQHARGREERGRIYGKEAHVCAGHDISRAVRGGRNGQCLFGQGRARESRG